MPLRQITDTKRTLTEGRQKFERLVQLLPQDQIDNRAALLLAEWQAFIDNDAEITKLTQVENFQSICGIGSRLSNRQSYNELMTTAASGFAEVDLAVHIVRERNAHVKKLMEIAGSQQCDFQVATDPVLLVESKYIENPTARRIENALAKAVDQIVETAQQQSLTTFDGSVWIFSYKAPAQLNNIQLQELITDLNAQLRSQVNGTLRTTLQVYAPGSGAGLYGDSRL